VIHHTSLLLPLVFPSVAEEISLVCKRLVSSNLKGLSSANGKDLVTTFKISETSVAEDEDGIVVCFGTSCIFVFSEDISASFHFLGANTFGSDIVFRFFKASWSSLTDRIVCLLRTLTILFLLIPLAPSSSLPYSEYSEHPWSLTDLLSLYSFQEFHCTWFLSSLSIQCMVL
jgi:hypothetical protein